MRWPGPGVTRAALLVGVAAGLLYVATGSRVPVPEASASLLVEYLHLTPFPPLSHALWSWTVRGLAAVSGPAHAVAVIHLFNAVCGGVTAGLLALVVGFVSTPASGRSRPGARLLGAAAAGAVLATSVPFWLVGNRAHPMSFSLLLLLLAVSLVARYAVARRPGWLYAGAAAYGVAIADYGPFVVALPFLAGYALLVLWRAGQLRAGRVVLLAGCLMTAPILMLVSAIEFYSLPAAAWRHFTSFGLVLQYQLLEQRSLLLSSVPRHGWLLLLVTTFLPGVLAGVAVRRLHVANAGWGLLLMLVVLSGVALLVLFNAAVAPWSVLGLAPLVVTPYLFFAAGFGFLLQAWALVLADVRFAPRFWLPALGVLAAILCATAAVRNAPETSTRAASPVHRLAVAALDRLAGREIAISEGSLDPFLKLEAWRRGQALAIVVPGAADLDAYRGYLASLMDDGRLRSRALAGLGPLAVDWLRHGTNAAARLAMATTPNLWLIEGYALVPAGWWYLGEAAGGGGSADDLLAGAREFWSHAGPALEALSESGGVMEEMARRWSRQAARVANDTGIALENAARPADAREAYRMALQFQPGQPIAAANLLVLAQEQGWAEDAAEMETLVARARDEELPASVGTLTERYGHLRTAEAAALYARGQPPAAPEPDPAWQGVVQAYMGGQRAEARQGAERLLQENPDRDEAWVLLAQIAFEQGDAPTVERALRQMRVLGREWPALYIILGRAAYEHGAPGEARDYFERAATLQPGNLRAQEALLRLDLRLEDYERAAQRVRRILAVHPEHPEGNLAHARILRENKQYAEAEAVVRDMLERGRDPRALAELAWLAQERGDGESALAAADEALRLNSRLAEAWAAKGRVLVSMGQPDAGRAALEQAVQFDPRPFAPRFLLAEALFADGEFEKSRELAGSLIQERGRALTPEQRKSLRALAGPR